MAKARVVRAAARAVSAAGKGTKALKTAEVLKAVKKFSGDDWAVFLNDGTAASVGKVKAIRINDSWYSVKTGKPVSPSNAARLEAETARPGGLRDEAINAMSEEFLAAAGHKPAAAATTDPLLEEFAARAAAPAAPAAPTSAAEAATAAIEATGAPKFIHVPKPIPRPTAKPKAKPTAKPAAPAGAPARPDLAGTEWTGTLTNPGGGKASFNVIADSEVAARRAAADMFGVDVKSVTSIKPAGPPAGAPAPTPTPTPKPAPTGGAAMTPAEALRSSRMATEGDWLDLLARGRVGQIKGRWAIKDKASGEWYSVGTGERIAHKPLVTQLEAYAEEASTIYHPGHAGGKAYAKEIKAQVGKGKPKPAEPAADVEPTPAPPGTPPAGTPTGGGGAPAGAPAGAARGGKASEIKRQATQLGIMLVSFAYGLPVLTGHNPFEGGAFSGLMPGREGPEDVDTFLRDAALSQQASTQARIPDMYNDTSRMQQQALMAQILAQVPTASGGVDMYRQMQQQMRGPGYAQEGVAQQPWPSTLQLMGR